MPNTPTFTPTFTTFIRDIHTPMWDSFRRFNGELHSRPDFHS